MRRPGVLRGMVTGASVFLLATLVLSIAGGAALTDADGSPAERLSAFSYVNVLASSLLGATAGVWQASRAELASRTDAVIAGFAGPAAAAALMLVIGGGGWSLAEILLSLTALAAGAGAGAGIMARRLQYVTTD